MPCVYNSVLCRVVLLCSSVLVALTVLESEFQTAGAEVSSPERLYRQWIAGRAKGPRTVARLYVAVEVGWCCGIPDLERQRGRLVDDLLLDRQPVQSVK